MLNRSYHHIHRIILPAGDALVGGAHAVPGAGVPCVGVWLGVYAAAAVTPRLHPPLVQGQQRHEPGHLGSHVRDGNELSRSLKFHNHEEGLY